MAEQLKPTKVELPLKSEAEVEQLVHDFESLALPYHHWTHRAHLAVAVVYVRRFPYDVALSRLRRQINAYNAVRGDPTGYNETVTIMFLRKIKAEAESVHCRNALHEEVARLTTLCQVEWLTRYYSRQLIWSAAAKANWVDPDLAPLDF